jgi:hypothetical protein
VKRENRPPRKIRTTVTRERLIELNKRFKNYDEEKRAGEISLNLKEIAKELGLGYSTLLHKYRQFQLSGEV